MDMKKITCLAIDDEPLALQQLAAYIRKVPYLELKGMCHSAMDAKKIMDEDIIDAIFCDINMPDLNGMDFVKSLAMPPLIVFTTAYADYAIEGYKVDAVDYLLKPFGLDEFRRAAEKVRKRMHPAVGINSYNSDDTQQDMSSSPKHAVNKGKVDDDTIFVKTSGRTVKINIADITYIEGMSEYLKIHLDGRGNDGNPLKPVITLYSMKKMEGRLPDYFMRIHRSYIVNVRKIQEVNKNRVIMDADTYLPVGDLYRDKFYGFVNGNTLGK